jgi:outer membrane receptor protein involved in Fe transport
MMTRLQSLATTAAVLAALPALALAQAQTAPAPDMNASPPDPAATAPAATSAGVNTSSGQVSADQLPASQANALASGDNKLLSNGPVPDTPANRARFGGPMSHGGKKTQPAGN